MSYNRVQFKNSKQKKAIIIANSPNGGQFEIRLGGVDGTLITEGNLEKNNSFTSLYFNTKFIKSGTYDLYFISKSTAEFEVDAIKFD